MLCSEFDFHLPEHLIAQQPLANRDESRMLVVNRADESWKDERFTSLPQFLDAGDVIVLNNTKVFPARLLGHRMLHGQVGAAVEALLLRRLESTENDWEVLAKPGRALQPGAELEFGGGLLTGTVIAKVEEGRRVIRFEPVEDFDAIVDRIGNTPLPPYIKRPLKLEGEGRPVRLEESRYQTVFATERGAIAAPTAGLHFTEQVLTSLRDKGVTIAQITHHVGYATFQPIRVDHVEDHRIGTERYFIPQETAALVNRTRASGRRVFAVGTTSVRALESAASDSGPIAAGWGQTHLFIYPGYRFKIVDGLVTNFHLPQSSLLMLVSAFGGRKLTLAAYKYAVEAQYRFYSYGDCMLIV